MQWLLVFGLGGCGALLRVGVSHWLPVRELPWVTLAVNVAGCFAIGVLFELFEERTAALSLALRTGLVGGFLGGLTTFSSFGLETIVLVEEGRVGLAAGYVGASVALGLAAVVAGVALTRAVT